MVEMNRSRNSGLGDEVMVVGGRERVGAVADILNGIVGLIGESLRGVCTSVISYTVSIGDIQMKLCTRVIPESWWIEPGDGMRPVMLRNLSTTSG
jgi:hypothetical protein